jgi:hypothetical protein
LNVLEYGEHLTERESVLEALGKRAKVSPGTNQHTNEVPDIMSGTSLTTEDIARELDKSRGTCYC